MPISTEFDDPYEPPRLRSRATRRRPRASDELPTFCKSIFIIELVFAGLRAVLVLLGFVGYAVMKQQQADRQLLNSAVFEIATGLGMVLTGIPANIFLLMRQRWATVVGWMYAVITVCSFSVAFWQLTIYARQFAPGSPQYVGAYVGGGITVTIRLALLVLYIVALFKFTQWGASQESWAQEISDDFDTE